MDTDRNRLHPDFKSKRKKQNKWTRTNMNEVTSSIFQKHLIPTPSTLSAYDNDYEEQLWLYLMIAPSYAESNLRATAQ